MRAAFLLGAALLAGCTEQTAPPAVPARPTDLKVAMTSPSTAQLTWNSSIQGEGEVTFSVYRNDIKVGTATTTDFTDTGLTGNATYTWFVTAKSSAGGISAPSDPAVLSLGDNDPPKVTSTSPANAAEGISRLPAPSVTFSEAMIPATINQTTITASIVSSGAIVYGSIDYDPATHVADFWPLSILPARTTIRITVGTGARDVSGNGVAGPFSFTFATGDTPATLADLPAHNEQILVSQGLLQFAQLDIFKMRADGSGSINLTNNIAGDFDASWSPDGRHIAFSSDRNGNLDVFIMREDGKGVTQLTTDAADESQPRWSPDARRIVYRSLKDGVSPGGGYTTSAEIFAMNADGTQQLNLTHTPTTYDVWPSWSPDGQRLMFTSIEYGSTNGSIFQRAPRIFVANADGSSPAPLRPADPNYTDDVAAWSPDGKQIAFSAANVNHPFSFENYFLFLINADGSNLRQLTSGGSQRFPAWSPDGSALVYSTSAFAEFWGRFGQIDVRKRDLATGAETILAPNTPKTQVMSPQAWRQ